MIKPFQYINRTFQTLWSSARGQSGGRHIFLFYIVNFPIICGGFKPYCLPPSMDLLIQETTNMAMQICTVIQKEKSHFRNEIKCVHRQQSRGQIYLSRHISFFLKWNDIGYEIFFELRKVEDITVILTSTLYHSVLESELLFHSVWSPSRFSLRLLSVVIFGFLTTSLL